MACDGADHSLSNTNWGHPASPTTFVCSLERAEMDLVGEKERLQVALGACQKEVGACQQELEQVRAEHGQLVEKLQASHKEERARLQQELEAGQNGQRSLEEKLTAYEMDSKKVCPLYPETLAAALASCAAHST